MFEIGKNSLITDTMYNQVKTLVQLENSSTTAQEILQAKKDNLNVKVTILDEEELAPFKMDWLMLISFFIFFN